MRTIPPILSIGVLEKVESIRVKFLGHFYVMDSDQIKTSFSNNDTLIINKPLVQQHKGELFFHKEDPSAHIEIQGVIIGKQFHWEQSQNQVFDGLIGVKLLEDGLTLINYIDPESYLKSVIASEMSGTSSIELLKAHAVISRSWVLAQMEERDNNYPTSQTNWVEGQKINNTYFINRWYSSKGHKDFLVCADDHCQRYQGMYKKGNANAVQAVDETYGMILSFENKVCDARFSKCCGGYLESYHNCWDDTIIPYLTSVKDAEDSQIELDLTKEENARKWIDSNPSVYCNVSDKTLLKTNLPDFDQSTSHFFRWKKEISNEELQQIIKNKLNIETGAIQSIHPLKRGPSGRIYQLEIKGAKNNLIVGKELEIRRLLSQSHLYSSCFYITPKKVQKSWPDSFILKGAGWGHGVGLCQIGAAAMAYQGKDYRTILKHYYPGAQLTRYY